MTAQRQMAKHSSRFPGVKPTVQMRSGRLTTRRSIFYWSARTARPQNPWLTVVIDDYSRVVAGYYLSFEDPFALNTSLALRQAIWRKEDPRWIVCGIPDVLYTDLGATLPPSTWSRSAPI